MSIAVSIFIWQFILLKIHDWYFSYMNLGILDKSVLAYVTHVAADLKWVAPYVEKSREELACCKSIIEEDAELRGSIIEAKERLLSGAYMDEKLQGAVQGVAIKEEKVRDSMKHSGFLVLVANKE